MVRIIQWNCRGLLRNIDDIHELLEKSQPSIICLQETHLSSVHNNPFRKYNLYRKDRRSSLVSSGGVAIVIPQSIPTKELKLKTTLEAVAIRTHIGIALTICSLYIPPTVSVTQNDLFRLIDELPVPFLLLGDLNAHNVLWGSARCDTRGRLIETVVLATPLHLFNNGSPTYICSSTRTESCIDISLATPSLSAFFTWSTLQNPLGSDHYPVFLDSTTPVPMLPDRTKRWKLEQANWPLFEQACEIELHEIQDLNADEACSLITSRLLEAAKVSIPESSGTLPKRSKPWWNSDCRDARRKQNCAWSHFRRYPTAECLVNFKRLRAEARKIRRQSKKASWQDYVNSISSNVSAKTVWDRVRKVSGTYSAFTVPLFDGNKGLAEQANILAEYFAKVSSSAQYSESFLRYKERAEKRIIKMNLSNEDAYNAPFSMAELHLAIAQGKSQAAGPDRIHYEMLRHLTPGTLKAILHFFNKIWFEAYFPVAWQETIMLPLLKPGKDRSEPASYRPIALTSCLGKCFERMINKRLTHFLEENHVIDAFQFGFRARHSTTDHLLRLETKIRESFVQRQHCVSVFFDLSKAYDTTWKHGIMLDLQGYGLKGRMLGMLKSYLSNRSFRVKFGTVLSDVYTQENGVPQGGVLSVTLFLIKLNSVAQVIPKSLMYSLYADDIQISFSSCNLASCERQLQIGINRLVQWAEENGYSFCAEKTVCVPFSLYRGIVLDPQLRIKSAQIPVRTEHKFLGLIFDQKLTFKSHINYLKQKCLKSMNVLKHLSYRTWGSDRTCLLRLYNSLIRSQLDYGCFIYGSSRESVLKALDPIHHSGLRISTGAFRTSPVQSLYAETNQWSLNKRRVLLGNMYIMRILSCTTHPCRQLFLKPRFETLFTNKPRTIPTMFFRYRILNEALDFYVDDTMLVTHRTGYAPWEYRKPQCDFSLLKYNKHNTPKELLQQEFLDLQFRYAGCATYFTDGSKGERHVGAAAVGPYYEECQRLRHDASIFTAELHAIQLVLNKVCTERTPQSVIFSDSLSALAALCSGNKTKNPLVQQVLNQLMDCSRNHLDVSFCWVPSHVGIDGNEKADALAAQTKELEVTETRLPYQDYRRRLKLSVTKKWQSEWTELNENKLHLVKPHLREWQSCRHKERFVEVVLCRLRIGHTRLTHNFLLLGEDPPNCEQCGKRLTVLHILVECPGYENKRREFFSHFYKFNIPLHPVLLLGDEPLVPLEKVFKFFSAIKLLQKL